MKQQNNYTININGTVLDLSEPCVMSIINVTPNSFWSGSRNQSDREVIDSVEKAITDGASILDIGGYSTRPGADEVSEDEEINRIVPALKTIKSTLGDISIPISIDTFRSSVAQRALDIWGGIIVNDISAGDDDPKMLPFVAYNKLPYIAMHKKGTPKTMASLNQYNDDIVSDILDYFSAKIKEINGHGINDLILDIGFGFAKDIEQNFELIRRYDEFSVMGYPTLAGISRKRMIYQTLGIDISEALNGTSALHWKLLSSGVSILRVHDTKEASEIIKLYKIVMNELS